MCKDILKNTKSGKLRKNSIKKITALLEAATSIEFKTQSMGMDDCWNANEPKKMAIDEFWTWYEKEYADLCIWVDCSDGVVTRVRFSDCIYHFSNDVVLTFAEAEAEAEAIDETRKVVSLGDYQDRLNSKRDRLEERAEKATQQSNSYYQSSKQLSSMIPFGQPILVGHHSEKRARAHADRIYNDMGKSVAASKKADYFSNRAQSVGTAGIASDDPEAIQKLKSKLAALESAQQKMKSANKVIKSKHMTNSDKLEYLMKTLNFTEKQSLDLLQGDFCGRIGFASYALQNNNATIRKTRERIAELEVLHNQKPISATGIIEGLNWSAFEDDGRIKFSFEGKPSETVRTTIKSHGFKWSRYSMAWVRKITGNAVNGAERLINSLNELASD